MSTMDEQINGLIQAMQNYIDSGNNAIKQSVDEHRIKFPNENPTFYRNLISQIIDRDSVFMTRYITYILQKKGSNANPVLTYGEITQLIQSMNKLKDVPSEKYRYDNIMNIIERLNILKDQISSGNPYNKKPQSMPAKNNITEGNTWKEVNDGVWVFKDPEYPITIQREIRNGMEVYFESVEDKANHRLYADNKAYHDMTTAKLAAIERIRQLSAVPSTKRSVVENATLLLNYIAQHQPVDLTTITRDWNPVTKMERNAATDAVMFLLKQGKIRPTPEGYVINKPETQAKPPEWRPTFQGRQGKLF